MASPNKSIHLSMVGMRDEFYFVIEFKLQWSTMKQRFPSFNVTKTVCAAHLALAGFITSRTNILSISAFGASLSLGLPNAALKGRAEQFHT